MNTLRSRAPSRSRSHLGLSSCAPPAARWVPAAPRRHARSVCAVAKLAAAEEAGPSGYSIQGNRPTSPKAWEIVSTTLRKSGLKMVSPQDVTALQKRGAVVLDVRPSDEYDGKDGRIPGAASAQFYRLIQDFSVLSLARRATFAFFGILNGTEFNPAFIADAEAAVPRKSSTVIAYCNIGGSLEATGPSQFGRQSRSLNAAYELQRAGFKDVRVLDGGFYGWLKEDMEVERDA